MQNLPFSQYSLPSDNEWVAQWYNYKTNRQDIAPKCFAKSDNKISDLKTTLKECIKLTNLISDTEAKLRSKLTSLTNSEWCLEIAKLKESKEKLDGLLNTIDDETVRGLKVKIKKRNAKRLRIKNRKAALRTEKEEMKQTRAEKHREIDQKLEKMKEAREKAYQDEETKKNTDAVLRDVLKRKADGRHNLALLDALVRLRNARKTTAIGRGEKLPNEEMPFHSNIDKLKTLWTDRMKLYEDEEKELRQRLADKQKYETERKPFGDGERILDVIKKWRELLFGDSEEHFQRNFNGDLQHFLSVRSEWDQFISHSEEGSALPIGWVIPKF